MKRLATIAAAAATALLIATTANAEVTLNSVRVGGKDTEALAKFYQSAFGMHEVNRIQAPNGPELFLNFGATAEEAKANKALRLVLMHRDSDDVKDSIPHVIFNVTDIAATVTAVKAAGGSMQSEPRPFGNTGLVIGIARDPVGNLIELIQPRKQ